MYVENRKKDGRRRMFEIILISHGPLSKAMLETAQMIVGEQEHVTCFGDRKSVV